MNVNFVFVRMQEDEYRSLNEKQNYPRKKLETSSINDIVW